LFAFTYFLVVGISALAVPNYLVRLIFDVSMKDFAELVSCYENILVDRKQCLKIEPDMFIFCRRPNQRVVVSGAEREKNKLIN